MVMVGSSVVLMSLRNTGTPPFFFEGKIRLKETEMLHRFRWVVDTKAANRGIRAVWILHRQ